MTDPHNQDTRETPHGDGTWHEGDILATIEDAVRFAKSNGFIIGDNLTILQKWSPEPTLGITVPSWYKVMREPYGLGPDARYRMVETMSQKEALRCIVNPLVDSYQLRTLVNELRRWNMHMHTSYIDYVPQKRDIVSAARAYVPLAEWFDPAIRRLKFGDIFSLWGGNELELVKLHLGRICVGPDGDPSIDGGTVEHTYRTLMVIDGMYAGQGKTRLFRLLIDALHHHGYTVCDGFPALNSVFNLAQPVQSDFMYRDDITGKALEQELSSPAAKIIATSGALSTQDKGVDAVRVKARGAILYCANRIERQLRWGLDQGMNSRLAIVPTLRQGEVPDDKLPHMFIPKYAEEHNVSTNAIMMWACRLAVDEFTKYVGHGNGSALRDRVLSLAGGTEQVVDPMDAVIHSLAFCLMLSGKPLPNKLNSDNFHLMVYYMRVLKQVNDASLLNKYILKSFQNQSWHPVHGLKLIDVMSLSAVHSVCPLNAPYPNDALRNGLKTIAFVTGTNCYANTSVAMQRWQDFMQNQYIMHNMRNLVDQVQNEVKSRISDIPELSDKLWQLSEFSDIISTPLRKNDPYYES